MDPLLGIPVGLALSTAAGLRVFVPLLLTSVAARNGYLALTPSMAWIASDAALVAFVTAATIEIAAYYVPWLDNLVDAIATPAAITAGIIEMAAVTPELPPLLRWWKLVILRGLTSFVGDSSKREMVMVVETVTVLQSLTSSPLLNPRGLSFCARLRAGRRLGLTRGARHFRQERGR